MILKKIVSGGQTGVDRGALDAALVLKFPCGGWCPDGRLAEDGVIDDRYPMQELIGGDYADRTTENVKDADGTAIIHYGDLVGGTAQTYSDCKSMLKPYLLIDATQIKSAQAASLVYQFIQDKNIAVLNVAGPRESKVKGAYEYSYDVISILLNTLGTKP